MCSVDDLAVALQRCYMQARRQPTGLLDALSRIASALDANIYAASRHAEVRIGEGHTNEAPRIAWPP